MAKTTVLDQHGQTLGFMPGFRNYVRAYVDDRGVPWLPIDGYAFYQMAQQMAGQMQTIAELEAKLKGPTND